MCNIHSQKVEKKRSAGNTLGDAQTFHFSVCSVSHSGKGLHWKQSKSQKTAK